MDATSYLLGKKSSGGGPTPTGTINITENGQHDVTNYATASVSVEPDLETKSVTITENTTTTITPTTGKDGLSSVQVTTNVSGGSVETINDVNDVITNYGTKIKNMPTTYETITQNPITLYYPATNYTSYFIYMNLSGKYKIGWGVNYSTSNWGLISKKYGNYYQITPCDYRQGDNKNMTFYTASSRYYSTNNYDTIEECITAIQSNETAYTQSSSDSYYIITSNASIILSNAYCVDDTTKEHIIPKRISSNETIEVIS